MEGNQSYQLTASSCSKVLVSGGYLILDPQNEGIVLATDARFHTTIQGFFSNDVDLNTVLFRVDSPQFNQILEYQVIEDPIDKMIRVKNVGSENSFIDKCIFYIVQTMAQRQLYKRKYNKYVITLKGDNSFYSQRELFGDKFCLRSLVDQVKCDIPLDPFKKTGMGSSAALITSFLAAVFEYTGFLQLNKSKDNSEDNEDSITSSFEALHAHAQILNAFVQEKIGSGFDIACSIFGSQIYRRFSNIEDLNEIVQLLQKKYQSDKTADVKDENILSMIDHFSDQLRANYKLNKFELDNNLDICLIDVASGSDTKIMVKKVLDWSKSQNEQGDVAFQDPLFKRLREQYFIICEYSSLQSSLINSSDSHQSVKEICRQIRKTLQEISKLSGVEIEPEAQTNQLDFLLSLENVIYTIIPGAGGNDAIFLIGQKDDLQNRVQKMFCEQELELGKQTSVLPIQILREAPIVFQYK